MNPSQPKGTVSLVGAGPGDPGLLTVRGRQRIEEAEVVVYDYLVSEGVRSFIAPGAERLFVGKQAGKCAMVQPEINALLVRLAREGKRVVRLKGGDPFLFGRGGEECSALEAAGVSFEVVPGVSSSLAAPAYAGIPVTDRRYASSLTIATGHGAIGEDGPVDWRGMSLHGSTLVVLMGMRKAREIAAELLAGDNLPATPVAVIAFGTLGSQHVYRCTLGELAQSDRTFRAPGVIVVGEVVKLRDSLDWAHTRLLHGVRVWNTRPVGKEGNLTACLQARGADVVHAPMVVLERLGAAVMAELREKISEATILAVTSSLAAQIVVDEVPSPPPQLTVAAVGAKTANVLRAGGWPVHILPDRFSAESLAGRILDEVDAPEKAMVLFPRGERAKTELTELLRNAGARVQEHVVYSNRAREHCELEADVRDGDIAVITSLLGAEAWLSREELGEIPVIALSESIAKVLRSRGRTVTVVEKPGDEYVVAAIENCRVHGKAEKE